MEKVQRLQIDPKIDHSLKLISNLSKKVEEMNVVEEKIIKRHAELMAGKTEEINVCQTELGRVTEDEAQVQQQIQETDAAMNAEENEMTEMKAKYEENRAFIDEIRAIEAATTEFIAEKDVKMQLVDNIRLKIDMTDNEINLKDLNIEEIQSQKSFLQEQATFLDKQLEDLTYLMNWIQRKTSHEEMETDKIFVREIMNEPFYIENKQKAIAKIKENKKLTRDMQNFNKSIEKQTIEHENLQKELKEIAARIILLQREVDVITKEADEKQQDLQTRTTEARSAENALNREIQKLQTEFVKRENELDIMRSEHSAAIEEFNLKIKMEELKTQKARDQQLELGNDDMSLSLPINTPVVINASHSQPPLQKRQKIDETSEGIPHAATQCPTDNALMLRSLITPPMSSSFESSIIPRNIRYPSLAPIYKEADVTPPSKETTPPAKVTPPSKVAYKTANAEEVLSENESSVSS